MRNQLRSALAKFFPGALPLLGDDPMELRDALAVLSLAANPEQGRRLCQSKIRANLARHGRQRNLELKAAQIQAQLRTPQLELSSPKVTSAYSDEVSYVVRTLLQVRSEVAQLEEQMTADFREHPVAEILLSPPGLGNVLGARVLGESGDDPCVVNPCSVTSPGNRPITFGRRFTSSSPPTSDLSDRSNRLVDRWPDATP